MEKKDQGSRGIKTADRVFDIIDLIRNRGPIGTTELASELELAKSTVYEYLNTLERREYITRRENAEYTLSMKFLEFGEELRDDLQLVQTAQRPVEQLAEETGEVAWVYVEEHGYAVPVVVKQGQQAVQIVGRVGNRKPLHLLSAGKAMLAEMSRERIEDIVDRHGLAGPTERAITDRGRLFEELDAIRERGYALNDEEEVKGIRAVGMAVTADDEVHGAVSVSGPTNRIAGDYFRDTLPEILSGAVNEIELKLVYSD